MCVTVPKHRKTHVYTHFAQTHTQYAYQHEYPVELPTKFIHYLLQCPLYTPSMGSRFLALALALALAITMYVFMFLLCVRRPDLFRVQLNCVWKFHGSSFSSSALWRVLRARSCPQVIAHGGSDRNGKRTRKGETGKSEKECVCVCVGLIYSKRANFFLLPTKCIRFAWCMFFFSPSNHSRMLSKLMRIRKPCNSLIHN